MKSKTQSILRIMRFLSWVVFILLLIQAGAMIFAYIYSLARPEASNTFIQSFDWMRLKSFSQGGLFIVFSLSLIVICLEALTASIIIKILNTIHISDPFKKSIADQLQKVSYLIFAIWLTTVIVNSCKEFLNNKISIGMQLQDISFILLAGIIFIFAQIFKRGIEIQSENEMTI